MYGKNSSPDPLTVLPADHPVEHHHCGRNNHSEHCRQDSYKTQYQFLGKDPLLSYLTFHLRFRPGKHRQAHQTRGGIREEVCDGSDMIYRGS